MVIRLEQSVIAGSVWVVVKVVSPTLTSTIVVGPIGSVSGGLVMPVGDSTTGPTGVSWVGGLVTSVGGSSTGPGGAS